MNLSVSQLNFRLFNSYKIKECENQSCEAREGNYQKMSKCIFFHNKNDQRRYPLNIKIKEMTQNNDIINKLKKGKFLISDFFKKYLKKIGKEKFQLKYINEDRINDSDIYACLNQFEKNFHPLNFKSSICKDNECLNKFCPFYHFSTDFENDKNFYQILDTEKVKNKRNDFLSQNKVKTPKVRDSKLNDTSGDKFINANFKDRKKVKKISSKNRKHYEVNTIAQKQRKSKKKKNHNYIEIVSNKSDKEDDFKVNNKKNAEFIENNKSRDKKEREKQNLILITNQKNEKKEKFLNSKQKPKKTSDNSIINKSRKNEKFKIKDTSHSIRSKRLKHILNSNSNSTGKVQKPENKKHEQIKKNLEQSDNLTKDKDTLAKSHKNLLKNNFQIKECFHFNKRNKKIKKNYKLVVQKLLIKNLKKKEKKHQLKKINNLYCLSNTSPNQKFYLNQEMQIFEDLITEFKNHKKLESEYVLKYICGFLNAKGGKIFFGINDDGIIKGINLNQQDMKIFVNGIKEKAALCCPPILENQYQITFHDVCFNDEAEYIIMNKYVVEIEIFILSNYNDLYLTPDKKCFLKRLGSLNLLKINEVIELVKIKHC